VAVGFAIAANGCGTGDGASRSPTDSHESTGKQVEVDLEVRGHDADSWTDLTVLSIADPRDSGAAGDGFADDTAALQAALDSLDGGGIVPIDANTTYRTTDVVRIRNDHVKLWAPDGSGRIIADTDGRKRRQAIVVDGASHVGLFGFELSSTADRRLYALEDSAVVLDEATDTEIVGLEIANSASAAIMVFGRSTRTFVSDNVIHHTWADAVHFTDGAQDAWVWDNRFFTEEPWPGDDGIACVTYGSGPRCGRMEWWNNIHFGSGWGRGMAVVGGEDIDIHHNTVRGTGAAGILVASEPSYDTAGSTRITVRHNVVVDAGHAVPHPGILISGLDGSISDVVVADNIVLSATGREAFRAEGEVDNLLHTGTTTPGEHPGAVLDAAADFEPSTTIRTVLGTHDPTLVAERDRRGLFRVQVRRNEQTGHFEQRFEYLVTGPRPELKKWRNELIGESTLFCPAGPIVGLVEVDCQLVARTPIPVRVPVELEPLSFVALRLLTWGGSALWSHLNDL